MSKAQFMEENLQPGEIYAGLILGKNGTPDYHLFLRPENPEKTLSWPEAMAWAKSIGYELPTRQDQSLLFANCQPEFENAWYWSSEQYSHYNDCAWLQNFYDCYQSGSHKSNMYRARAVRRVPLCDE